MYTLLELESKTFGELKKIGYELNVLPKGDRRCRQSWIDAIAGVNPPLLQLLEVSPADVEPVVEEVIESQAQEPLIITPLREENGFRECLNCEDGFVTDRWGDIVECPRCDGSQWVKIREENGFRECLNCEFGFVADRRGDMVKCPRCDGSQWVRIEDVEPQAQEPIAQAAKNSPGVDVDPAKVRNLDYLNCPRCRTVSGLYSVSPGLDGKSLWETRCIHCDYIGYCIRHPFEDVRPFEVDRARNPIDNSPGVDSGANFDRPQESISQAAETSPAASVEPVQDTPLVSKFGRIVDPKPAVKPIAHEEARPQLDRAQSADVHNWGSHPTKSDRDSSGAKTEALGSQEGDRVLEVAGNHQTGRGRVLPDKSTKLVNQPQEPNENPPGVEVDPVQEPIAQVAENSPGVEVDYIEDILPDCVVCFGEKFIEDPSGCILNCSHCTEARVSQSAIGSMAGNSLGVEVSFSDRKRYWADRGFFLIPEVPAVPENNPAVEFEGCIYCTSPEYQSLRNETYRCYRCEPKPDQILIVQDAENSPGVEVDDSVQEAIAPAAQICLDKESDQNPILTGVSLSDRFVARYSPPQVEIVHFQSDADGQLSLLDFEVELVTDDEPPDPDDFESLDAFREAIARWDGEHPSSLDHFSDYCSDQNEPPDPYEFDSMFAFWAAYDAWDKASDDDSEPLEISLESFCEWAPCPADWYEPIALHGSSNVLEMSPACKSSITSDFLIPTFDAWCDRSNGIDEPPDTGIFAWLPKPKPPKFPPQAASWVQVEHKLGTSWTQVTSSQLGIPKLSRNYPETIPILFHRVAAGSSAQPARSPPGGDSMS